MYGVTAARLFDGIGALSARHPLVCIEGRQITSIHDGYPSDYSDMNIIDLGDVTLMPGLIDCHQHIVFDASDDPVGHLASREDAEVIELARVVARRALVAGITTVRDLGDRNFLSLALRDEFATDLTAGPELLVAGPPITTPDGHCWFLGGTAHGVDGVREAVRDHAAHDVDVIKVMVTGGSLTPGSSNFELQYSPPELQAVAQEAHQLGLRVTGHAKGVRGIAAAVNAGFDGIEHCLFLTPDGPRPDAVLICRMAEIGIYASWTCAFKYPRDMDIDKAFLDWQEQADSVARTMRAAGVRLVLSSDGGASQSIPHDALPCGLERLRRTGMPEAEALRSVTSLAADACGLGQRKGMLAPGYDADIIAVNGDPLLDVSSVQHVAAVFRGGVRVC
jgi:imidazolonepropionase-like amidohydrolase